MKETVSVTGGSGGIGQALLAQLVERYRVKALFRKPSPLAASWEQKGCLPVWGDLADERACGELVEGARYVFHCAALVTRASFEKSYAVNVEGTRLVAQAAAKHRCQRLVHVSSASVYTGLTAGAFSEELEAPGRDRMAVYPRTKLESEWAVRDVGRECGIEWTILRPTFVYGPNTQSYTLVPIELIRKGLPVQIGDGTGMLDAVYVDDVAAALILAAESPQAAGQTFNIGNQPVSFRDFYAYFGRMLNRPVRQVPLPALKALERSLVFLGRGLSAQKGIAFLVSVAENRSTFPSSKAQALLGYSPRFSLDAGMLNTEIWAKKSGRVPRSTYGINGYGPLLYRPVAVAHPGSETELVQALQAARQSGCKVRAAGSLHSQAPMPDTEGISLFLDRYNKLLNVEGCLVTVQAGMKLRDLNAALTEFRLALPILGAIAEQTVAGAISTATHGGSAFHGSLSDCVEALTLIKADGSVHRFGSGDPEFPAVVVSLGLLGIFSTVTLRCVPAFALRSVSLVADAADTFRDFNEINRDNLYVDMLYFAATDQVEILTINPPKGEQFVLVDPGTTNFQPSGRRRAVAERRLKTLGLRAIAFALRRHVSIQKRLTRLSVGHSYRPRTGRSDLVLAFGDSPSATRVPGLVGDMEVAIPYERATEALLTLRDSFRSAGRFPLMPVHVRCSPASSAWMSPAYGQEICWIEVSSYPSTDTLFTDVHTLLAPFRYRSHWGKKIVADRSYLHAQYERWDDFNQLRQAWDPHDIFLNQYLAQFFAQKAEEPMDEAQAVEQAIGASPFT